MKPPPSSFLDPPEELQRALTVSLKLLSLRARSEKEIIDNLGKKQFSNDTVSKVLGLLKKDGLIDDMAFAKWWIEQRQEFRPKGTLALKDELKQKGIREEIIEEAIESLVDDLKSATDVIKRKWRKFERLKGDEYKKKVSDFLYRRGFSWKTIQKVLATIDIPQ